MTLSVNHLLQEMRKFELFIKPLSETMKKIVLLASLLVCSFYSYSQNNIRLDSLNKEFDRVDVLFDSLLHTILYRHYHDKSGRLCYETCD